MILNHRNLLIYRVSKRDETLTQFLAHIKLRRGFIHLLCDEQRTLREFGPWSTEYFVPVDVKQVRVSVYLHQFYVVSRYSKKRDVFTTDFFPDSFSQILFPSAIILQTI